MELRRPQSARRHRIGKAHSRHVITTHTPAVTETPSGETALRWTGEDTTGRELEIVAVVLEPSDYPLNPDKALVIHVMPTALRGKK
ncbi:MAG: hypothetical protein LBL55_11360 [Propionibacteriaceae bacterium]|nr:hypothetical protein [Propionibacteriaceae bacterium]